MSNNFAQRYPTIDHFVNAHGYIEIGYDENTTSFIRALDMGGWVWEGKDSYDSLEDALADLEQGLIAWEHEIGIDDDE